MDRTEDSYLSTSLSWPYMTWAEKNSFEQNYSRSKSQTRGENATLADSGGTSSNGNNQMKDLLIYIVKSFSPNIDIVNNTQLIDDILSIQENDEAVSENIKSKNANTLPARENNLAKKNTSQNNQILEDINNTKQEQRMNNETSKNVKTKVNNERQTRKLKNPILKQKKPVISFFDDIASPSMDNPIEIQNVSSISISNLSDAKTICDKAKKNRRSSKSARKDEHLKHNDPIMSKFTTYNRSKEKDQAEIEHKITKKISSMRRTLNDQPFTKFDPNGPFEDWNLPSSFRESFNLNNIQVGIMEQPSEEKNEETKAIDGRQSCLGDKYEKDQCLETYWNRTDMSFKFISKVFNILPPSKKVFDTFVEATKKNNSRDMKNKRNGDKINNAAGKVLPLRYLDQRITDVEQHKKCIETQTQTQKKESQMNFKKELSPDNMNMIKMALSKEIAKRFASNGQRDGICMQDFEKLVQEHVTNIINEIRAQKSYLEEATNGDQKNIQVYNLGRSILGRSKNISRGRDRHNSHYNELRKQHHNFSKEHRKEHQSYEKPISRATKSAQNQARTSVTKLDNVNIDYNRAMKRFQQNLLKTDSDCSALHKKDLPQKVRSLHFLKSNRTGSRSKYYRKETHSKIRGKSHEEGLKEREIILKNRRHEVEEKLKNSKKRNRPSHEKKALNETERIRELTHPKLELGTKKAIKKNPKTNCNEPGRKTPGPNHFRRDPRMLKKRTKYVDALFDTISSSYCLNNEEIETKNMKMTQRVSISKIYDRNNENYDAYENHSSDSNKTLSEHTKHKDTSNESISISKNLFRPFSIHTEDIVLTTASEDSNLDLKNQETKNKVQDKDNSTTVQDWNKWPDSIKKVDATTISLRKSENSSAENNDIEMILTSSEKKLIKIMKTRRNQILKLKGKRDRKL